MGGRAWLGSVLACPLLLLAAPAAQASLNFQPCATPAGVQCATLDVPIDRSGSVPGTLPLLVNRVPAKVASGRSPVVALAGGPGQNATELTGVLAAAVQRADPGRAVITYSDRGTGPSAISCPSLSNGTGIASAIPACANSIGAAKHSFTTRENADDLAAVLEAAGIPKATILGVSYGTLHAYAFAIRHPALVDSLILDSTESPETLDDPFNTASNKALPGALRALCAGSRCRHVPVGDLSAAVGRLFVKLRRRSIAAPFYDARGKRRTLLIDDVGTALLLGDLDLDRNARAELPRAVYGALHGDPAPLARLGGAAPVGAPPDPAGGVNLGLNLATNCEEWAWPFDRTAAPADRLNQGRAAAQQLPAADVQPFGRTLNFVLSQVPACSFWPMAAQRPDFGSAAPPDVPVLLLHGVFDVRTPTTGTEAVAAKFPHGRVVTVPNTGHSALGSDLSGCARKAVKTFLGGGSPAGCSTPADPYAPRAVVPTALKQVKPARRSHGTPGRAAAAAALTVTDVFQQIDVGTGFRPGVGAKVHGGGLRGGTYHGGKKGPVLNGVVFVPGVKVSGRVPRTGTAVLRLSGKLRGSLSFRANGTFKGTVGGKPVSGRLALTRRSPIEVAREKLNAAVFTLVPKLHRRAVYPGR